MLRPASRPPWVDIGTKAMNPRVLILTCEPPDSPGGMEHFVRELEAGLDRLGYDVTVLHRGLVESVWGLADEVDTVGYAHSVDEAVADARRTGGVAVLLRATPVAAVAAVAAEGARMPRKSTLFTPKPASGLVMRRFADQP